MPVGKTDVVTVPAECKGRKGELEVCSSVEWAEKPSKRTGR